VARLTTKHLPPRVNVPTKTRITINLEPYTPCMCGDYTGKHYQETTDNKIIPTGVPTAKSLIGKMRWLARYIILASTTPGIPILNHAQADEKYHVLTIKKKDKNEYHLGLIPFLFGTTHPIQWRGVVSIQLIGEDVYKVFGNESDIVDTDYMHGDMVFANTRFNFLTIRSKEGLYPLDLNKILKNPLKLTLTFDNGRLSEITKMNGNPACAKAFVIGLALTAPLVLGLGKGATRGFGRFLAWLDDDAGLRGECQLLDDLASHLEALREDGGKENIEGIFSALAGLAAQAAGKTRYNAPIIKVFIVEGRWTSVRTNRKKPATLSSRVKPVNRAIAAIGNATMKTFWKKMLGRSPYGPGSDIHTWILGLPRSQRFPINKSCYEKFRMRTGYVLGDNINDYKKVDGTGWKDWNPKEGRYQSPIIMFPLPPSGDQVRVVVLVLPQGDMAKLLTGFKIDKDTILYLYHAGVPGLRRYLREKKRGKEKVLSCEEDVGRVEAILRGVTPSNLKVDKLLGYALPGRRRRTLDRVDHEGIMGSSEFFEEHVLGTIHKILKDSSI